MLSDTSPLRTAPGHFAQAVGRAVDSGCDCPSAFIIRAGSSSYELYEAELSWDGASPLLAINRGPETALCNLSPQRTAASCAAVERTVRQPSGVASGQYLQAVLGAVSSSWCWCASRWRRAEQESAR